MESTEVYLIHAGFTAYTSAEEVQHSRGWGRSATAPQVI